MQREVDGIINCCSGRPVSLAEMAEGFIRERGFKIKLEYGKFPDRPYDSPGVWGDATKLRQILRDVRLLHSENGDVPKTDHKME